MSDQTLNCTNCHQEFVFTQGEQEFYAKKNLTPPKYCPICRGIHKAKESQFAPYKPKSSAKSNHSHPLSDN